MAAALYGPGGYYAERPGLGGERGDYFTSPELHPAFGALLGRQVAEVWDALGRPSRFDLVEQGPGTGALCRDLLTWADHDAPAFGAAVRYLLVEPSTPLRAAQRATLAEASLLDARIDWDEHSALGFDHPVAGCILANELVDAFPVHLVTARGGRLLERYVTLEDDRLHFVEDEPSTPELEAHFADLGLFPGEGCLAEVNLLAVRWMSRAAACLERGALLVLDYGYPAGELYAPHRRHGTLLSYRGHTMGSDPLADVGTRDITSHVDFTSLARAGERAGLTTVGLTDQATFLTSLGLRTFLRQLDATRGPDGGPLTALEHDANRRALLELIRPDGLGAVLVLLQTRGLSAFRPSGVFGPPPIVAGSQPAYLPILRPGQMRLPGPIELEGFADLEAQWREFWSGQGDGDDPGETAGA